MIVEGWWLKVASVMIIMLSESCYINNTPSCKLDGILYLQCTWILLLYRCDDLSYVIIIYELLFQWCFVIKCFRHQDVSQEVRGSPSRFQGIPSQEKVQEAQGQGQGLPQGRRLQARPPDRLHGLQGTNDLWLAEVKKSLINIAWFWYGMVWYGLVWFAIVLYSLVWYGLIWFGMVWFGKGWEGGVLVWYGFIFSI